MSVDHFKHLSSLYDNKPSHWYNFRFYLQEYKVWVLYVFSATFSHISFLSKWSVLLVEDSNRSTRRLNSLTNLINQCCTEYTLYHGWKSNSPSVDMIVDLFCENWFFRAMQVHFEQNISTIVCLSRHWWDDVSYIIFSHYFGVLTQLNQWWKNL
jgi:hypothetical protein